MRNYCCSENLKKLQNEFIGHEQKENMKVLLTSTYFEEKPVKCYEVSFRYIKRDFEITKKELQGK